MGNVPEYREPAKKHTHDSKYQLPPCSKESRNVLDCDHNTVLTLD